MPGRSPKLLAQLEPHELVRLAQLRSKSGITKVTLPTVETCLRREDVLDVVVKFVEATLGELLGFPVGVSDRNVFRRYLVGSRGSDPWIDLHQLMLWAFDLAPEERRVALKLDRVIRTLIFRRWGDYTSAVAARLAHPVPIDAVSSKEARPASKPMFGWQRLFLAALTDAELKLQTSERRRQLKVAGLQLLREHPGTDFRVRAQLPEDPVTGTIEPRSVKWIETLAYELSGQGSPIMVFSAPAQRSDWDHGIRLHPKS